MQFKLIPGTDEDPNKLVNVIITFTNFTRELEASAQSLGLINIKINIMKRAMFGEIAIKKIPSLRNLQNVENVSTTLDNYMV